MDSLMIQRTADIVAAEINDIKNKTRNMVMYNSIEIGRRLTEAKTMVEHGGWGKWLEEKVDYSPRTAQNLMKIFEQYGSSQLSLLDNNIKTQAFADLSYTQALALLDLPEEEREVFVEENNVQEMSTRELQQAVKEKQEALEQKSKAEAEKAETEAKLKKEQVEKAKAEEKLKAMNEKLRKKEKEAEDLAEQYNKLMESASEESLAEDNEELESLRESLSEADRENRKLQKEIAQLNEQLKAKPIPVEAVTVEERVPAEVQDELEKLREEKAIAGFKAAFNSVRDSFNSLLDEMEQLPEQYRDKYKGAVGKLLTQMKERL